jgi:hypothetical protein
VSTEPPAGANLFRVVPGPPKLALPGLLPVYELYVRAGAELQRQSSALSAELWVSAQLGELYAAAPDDEGFAKAVADLVKVLRRAGTPGAHAFLLGIAESGPPDVRPSAAKAAGELLHEGPAWAGLLGEVIAIDACTIQDGTLDRDQLLVEYRYRDGSGHHALSVTLSGGLPVQVIVVGDMMGMRSEIKRVLEEGECVVASLPLELAGNRLRDAFESVRKVPKAEMGTPFHAVLALAHARLALLP